MQLDHNSELPHKTLKCTLAQEMHAAEHNAQQNASNDEVVLTAGLPPLPLAFYVLRPLTGAPPEFLESANLACITRVITWRPLPPGIYGRSGGPCHQGTNSAAWKSIQPPTSCSKSTPPSSAWKSIQPSSSWKSNPSSAWNSNSLYSNPTYHKASSNCRKIQYFCKHASGKDRGCVERHTLANVPRQNCFV